MNNSPKYKNLTHRPKQSPIEIKEKLRKNYKSKVQHCRGSLHDKFRNSVIEKDNMCNLLQDIYKKMIDVSDVHFDADESLLEEIKQELIQEEIDWWLQEYEKTETDWSYLEQEDEVICPVCQKSNFIIENDVILCPNCNITLKISLSKADIKRSILQNLERHESICTAQAQFNIIKYANIEPHIYIICESCNEMSCVL